ncbi:MAG TPA: CPBP family intramembrane glutamic endopeptidase [Candidatus Dormibacteraeota bacterium]|nr:CPBP family intramembrane glutamic endopeptidase [Candidatus Dormibacteraeota bacterium]
MRDLIRRLSGGSEVLLVLFTAFGLSIPVSLAALFGGLPPATAPITDEQLLGAALYELTILTLLGLFLHVRGWTLEKLGLRPSVRESLNGLVLAAAAYLAYAALWIGAVALWPHLEELAAATRLLGKDLSVPNVLLISLVNPVFEEVFVCGYVITALRERLGMTAAINVSAGIRVFYHFYQGAAGVLGIVPIALLFAYWYARSGRLSPLIVAHAMLDVTALAIK